MDDVRGIDDMDRLFNKVLTQYYDPSQEVPHIAAQTLPRPGDNPGTTIADHG